MRSLISRRLKPLLVVSFLSFVGCDQSFDPQPAGSSSVIVYSILATDKPDQFVRVFATYPPSVPTPGSNTVEYPVTDAVVTIWDGPNAHPLSLVTLPRVDSTRYTSPIYAYRTASLPLRYGKTYELTVELPSSRTLSSIVTIPSKPSVFMKQWPVVEEPSAYPPSQKIEMTATIAAGTEAHLFRLLVTYDVLEGGKWIRKREEIPSRFRSVPPTIETAVYGQVTKTETQAVISATTAGVYTAVLDDIYQRTWPDKLVFNQAVVQFVQLDKNFYNYYMSVKGFQDPFSIRLDQPGYSNIKNGAGIFGGCSVDSLVQILPADFPHNRR